MMQGMGCDEGLRGLLSRYVATSAGGGWPDDRAHLRDLLVVVERAMREDREPARARSWQRLHRAIRSELA
jgi:hypothetical protein